MKRRIVTDEERVRRLARRTELARLRATVLKLSTENARLRKRLEQPTTNAKPKDELIVVNGAYQFDLRHASDNALARKLFHLANDIFRATETTQATDDQFQPHIERLRHAAMNYVVAIDDIRERIQR